MKFKISISILALCTSTQLSAAGLWLPEGVVSPDLGTATAGRAAAANDASTAGGNPAGMTRIDGTEVMAGFLGVGFENKFDNSSATTTTGGSGGQNGDFVPGLGSSFVYSYSDDLKFGLALGTYFGLGMDYGESWAGRYHVTKAELTTVGINPSVAYRINEWFSIGVGFNVVYANLNQESAVNNLGSIADGKVSLDESDVGFGGNIGFLIEPQKGTRFGLTYRSMVDLKFNDAVSFKGLGPIFSALTIGSADLEMTLPQAVLFSAYHQLNNQWAIMGNAGWQDWSDFGKTNITVKSRTKRSFTDNRHFRDTWNLAIGAQYRFLPDWKASIGFAYDSSPVSDSNRTPDMALDEQYRVGTGLEYDVNHSLTLGAAYEYMDAGNAPIDQSGGPLKGRLKGSYKENHIHFFNLTASMKF